LTPLLQRLRARLDQALDTATLLSFEAASRRMLRARRRRWASLATLDPQAQIHAEGDLINLRGDPSLLRIGAFSAVRAELLILRHGGSILVGDWCYLGAQTRIWSANSISIGHRVLIAHACEIHDWNAHPLDIQARHRHYRDIITSGHPARLDDVPDAPIAIEDDAWIGFGCTLLKGVTIGRGSIVAARSLVTQSVPPNVLVAGSPARIVRDLAPAQGLPRPRPARRTAPRPQVAATHARASLARRARADRLRGRSRGDPLDRAATGQPARATTPRAARRDQRSERNFWQKSESSPGSPA